MYGVNFQTNPHVILFVLEWPFALQVDLYLYGKGPVKPVGKKEVENKFSCERLELSSVQFPLRWGGGGHLSVVLQWQCKIEIRLK